MAGLLALGAAHAEETASATTAIEANSCGTRAAGDDRPRIGLALGGGGAHRVRVSASAYSDR